MRRFSLTLTALLAAVLSVNAAPAAAPTSAPPANRIASFSISEDMINQLLKQYLHTPFLQDASVSLDPEKDEIALRGLMKIPADELKAINVEKGLTDFRFQLAIKLKTTRRGHLILIFPLNQTFFYPAESTHPDQDRVVIPVQLLSLALASARGYLATFSGDFSGFDRQTQALQRQIADLDHQIAASTDPDEQEALQYDRKSLEIQLEAIPVQRKQAEKTAKKMANILGFVGEKEINLNQELSAHKNALILRIKVGQLAPYLQGIELGGVRLFKDERDGSGENFLAIDLNAQLGAAYAVPEAAHGPAKHAVQQPPAVVIRLNQALLESKAVLDAEKQDMSKHIRNFALDFMEDGIHVNGDWHEPLLPQIPFTSVVDFVWVSTNTFDIQVREVKVAHIELRELTRLVLEAAKNRLDKTLKGDCTFRYIGEEKDRARAIRVTVNMPAMLPAFPKLALTGIRIKERELILKTGQP